MFFRKKNKEKKKSRLDKLIMGAIVGGAVGSVIGMTIAPKSGKETREYLAQKGKDLYEKGKELKEKYDENHQSGSEKPKRKGLLSRIFRKLFGQKK